MLSVFRDVPQLTRMVFVRLLGLSLAFKYFDLAVALIDQALQQRTIGNTEAAALRTDVERCATFATRQALQVAADAESLLSGSFRDNLQPSDP